MKRTLQIAAGLSLLAGVALASGCLMGVPDTTVVEHDHVVVHEQAPPPPPPVQHSEIILKVEP